MHARRRQHQQIWRIVDQILFHFATITAGGQIVPRLQITWTSGHTHLVNYGGKSGRREDFHQSNITPRPLDRGGTHFMACFGLALQAARLLRSRLPVGRLSHSPRIRCFNRTTPNMEFDTTMRMRLLILGKCAPLRCAWCKMVVKQHFTAGPS